MSNSAIRLSCRIPERKKKVQKFEKRRVTVLQQVLKGEHRLQELSSIDIKVDARTDCF